MNHPDYNSPAELRLFLESQGMAMQKKFGQNFLVNAAARSALIDALDVQPGSSVWEVGPGLGAMTEELLLRGVSLTAFEIDHGFARLLPLFFADYTEKGTFSLVEGDVLKTWKPHLEALEKSAAEGAGETAPADKRPSRFFGNLPYNVAATIIADMIEAGLRFDKMVVTVQKEVGQRMCAKPSSADYSSFSVLCQWAYNVKPLMDLAGGNFWPRPNVDSRALLLTRREDFPRCKNPNVFMRLTRALFASRRKTIRNNMQQLLSGIVSGTRLTTEALEEKIFGKTGIAPSQRAENLSVEALLSLSDALSDCMIEAKLEKVKGAVAEAALKAGRAPADISLLAVSKFHPAEAVISAIEAGQRLFGENRVQEAARKFDQVRARGYQCDLHIIGQLQRNKVKEAVRIASCIESVDRIELLEEIEKQCAKIEKTISVFFELHTGEESKSGFADSAALQEALSLCALGRFPHVIPAGLMTMAPNTKDRKAVSASFATLRSCAEAMRKAFPQYELTELSMGMSQDYPLAIAEGATIVRIGTAIFGERS